MAVNASLRNASDTRSRMATLTHSLSSEDAFFDGLAVSDVEIAVEFSADSVPPPKLELVRFLDGGNGVDVRFDSPTNMVDGEWDVDCATLFESPEPAFGPGAACQWRNSSALRVTFTAGAALIPFDYTNATDLNSVWLKGGVLQIGPRRRDAVRGGAVRRGADAPAPWRRRSRSRRRRASASATASSSDARRHGRRVPRADVQLGRAGELGRRDRGRPDQRGGARGQARGRRRRGRPGVGSASTTSSRAAPTSSSSPRRTSWA